MRPSIDRAQVASLTSDLARLDDPAGAEQWLELARTLYAVGRADLPLGRLFEGHVDAIQIISRYGSAAQRGAAQGAARNGCVFGVWNADQPTDPTVLADGRLTGGKAFASGAGILTHALVTAREDRGQRLILVDLAEAPPQIDRSWWRVIGMQRSETHVVRWSDTPLSAHCLIGAPADYVREPWLSGGALRFAAVQAGGIAAVVDLVRDHLVTRDRAGDPYQSARLADLYLAAQAAADAVAAAARAWRADDCATTLAHVAAARVAVYGAGERVLTLAQAAVGVSAMFVEHPLAEMLTDLTVYLRQPAPDAQLRRVSDAVAAGILKPGL